MQILSEENHEGQFVYEDIMHWTPDGKAFVIENRAKVSTIILPRHFGGEAEFRSFTRRLLRWGFKRILQKGKGSSSATFQHEVRIRTRDHETKHDSIISNTLTGLFIDLFEDVPTGQPNDVP